jgi:hypothetical protein
MNTVAQHLHTVELGAKPPLVAVLDLRHLHLHHLLQSHLHQLANRLPFHLHPPVRL